MPPRSSSLTPRSCWRPCARMAMHGGLPQWSSAPATSACMRAVRMAGIQGWPSADVMEFMAAKDSLCKVASLSIGREDTLAYYTTESFAEGFKKTMKFQPRVLKQNRGSSGEGIWIIKLKSGAYCSEFGAEYCADDDVLEMMEANDNHAEEHTVKELMEFCIHGRNDKSGEWTSKGTGKYLEGGKEAALLPSHCGGRASAKRITTRSFWRPRSRMDMHWGLPPRCSAPTTRSLWRPCTRMALHFGMSRRSSALTTRSPWRPCCGMGMHWVSPPRAPRRPRDRSGGRASE